MDGHGGLTGSVEVAEWLPSGRRRAVGGADAFAVREWLPGRALPAARNAVTTFGLEQFATLVAGLAASSWARDAARLAVTGGPANALRALPTSGLAPAGFYRLAFLDDGGPTYTPTKLALSFGGAAVSELTPPQTWGAKPANARWEYIWTLGLGLTVSELHFSSQAENLCLGAASGHNAAAAAPTLHVQTRALPTDPWAWKAAALGYRSGSGGRSVWSGTYTSPAAGSVKGVEVRHGGVRVGRALFAAEALAANVAHPVGFMIDWTAGVAAALVCSAPDIVIVAGADLTPIARVSGEGGVGPPYSFAARAPHPTGWTNWAIDPATGLISGRAPSVPSNTGQYSASCSDGADTAVGTGDIEVIAGGQTFDVSTRGIVGGAGPHTAAVTATGGTPPYSFAKSGDWSGNNLQAQLVKTSAYTAEIRVTIPGDDSPGLLASLVVQGTDAGGQTDTATCEVTKT